MIDVKGHRNITICFPVAGRCTWRWGQVLRAASQFSGLFSLSRHSRRSVCGERRGQISSCPETYLTGGASRRPRLAGGVRVRPSTSSGQALLRQTEDEPCFVMVSLSNHPCREASPCGQGASLYRHCHNRSSLFNSALNRT
jgi:hypothetical protein